jgi:hypothetical protein
MLIYHAGSWTLAGQIASSAVTHVSGSKQGADGLKVDQMGHMVDIQALAATDHSKGVVQFATAADIANKAPDRVLTAKDYHSLQNSIQALPSRTKNYVREKTDGLSDLVKVPTEYFRGSFMYRNPRGNNPQVPYLSMKDSTGKEIDWIGGRRTSLRFLAGKTFDGTAQFETSWYNNTPYLPGGFDDFSKGFPFVRQNQPDNNWSVAKDGEVTVQWDLVKTPKNNSTTAYWILNWTLTGVLWVDNGRRVSEVVGSCWISPDVIETAVKCGMHFEHSSTNQILQYFFEYN